jgi:hypothetical protein
MSTSRLHARVAHVAAQMRVCASHGEPLVCLCRITWTGTEAQWGELSRLVERLLPYDAQIPRTGQVCSQCESHATCTTCYKTT